jgi:outer membrane receptor protein involved in Fe transport
MKKVAIAIFILALLGIFSDQAAMAWEWPFFSSPKEEAAEPVPALSEPSPPAPLALRPDNEFLSEDRLKFVARSYAKSHDFLGDEARLDFDGRLLATRGLSAGFAYQPTDFMSLYAEYSGLSLTADGPFADRLGDLGGQAAGWAAGAGLSLKGFSADLKYFDYQRLSQAPAGLEMSLPRPEETAARARGLEFSASWAMGQTFDWDFEFQPYFSLARLFEEPGASRALFASAGSPDLRLSYGLLFSHEKMGLSMSVEASNFGRRGPLYYSLAGEGFLDATVYDFHLVKRLYDWDEAGRLLLKADVTNIGDVQAGNSRSKSEEGRTFKTGLRYEY